MQPGWRYLFFNVKKRGREVDLCFPDNSSREPRLELYIRQVLDELEVKVDYDLSGYLKYCTSPLWEDVVSSLRICPLRLWSLGDKGGMEEASLWMFYDMYLASHPLFSLPTECPGCGQVECYCECETGKALNQFDKMLEMEDFSKELHPNEMVSRLAAFLSQQTQAGWYQDRISRYLQTLISLAQDEQQRRYIISLLQKSLLLLYGSILNHDNWRLVLQALDLLWEEYGDIDGNSEFTALVTMLAYTLPDSVWHDQELRPIFTRPYFVHSFLWRYVYELPVDVGLYIFDSPLDTLHHNAIFVEEGGYRAY